MSTAEHADVNRRDFLYIATGAMGAVGTALVAWPFISQMNPSASVLALAQIEFDLSPLAEGQSVTLKWQGNPVFVRHRTQAEIDAAKQVPMDDLKDPNARNDNLKGDDPATGRSAPPQPPARQGTPWNLWVRSKVRVVIRQKCVHLRAATSAPESEVKPTKL